MTSKQPDAAVRVHPFRAGIFADRVAIITGGGTGIGRVLALQMVELGAGVAICGRRPEPLAVVEQEVIAAGGQCFQAPCDIRDADAVAAWVDAVHGRFGRVDYLVNNAGGQFPTPAAALKPKGFDAVVRNNLSGTFNMTHAVANRAMIPQRSGRIINIIANILRGFPGMVHTGAARAGVENIQVNAVAPGTIVSTGTQQYDPSLLERAQQQTPAKRLGTVEEVAHLCSYLMTDGAEYITGTTLYIDGGAALWGNIWEVFDAD